MRLPEIVTSLRAPEAVNAAWATPELRTYILGNWAMSDEAFESIYRPGLPLDDAKRLACNAITDRKFIQVLRVETRSSVVSLAVDCDVPLSGDVLEVMMSAPTLKRAVANKVLRRRAAENLPLPWLRAAAEVSGKCRVELMLHDRNMPDTVVAENLRFYQKWGPARSAALPELLATRPAVISAAAHSDSLRVRQAATGCRHLLDPADQRAVADLDDVDGKNIAWHEEREFIRVALACNPACSLPIVKELAGLLSRYAMFGTELQASSQIQGHPDRLTGPVECESRAHVLDWLISRTLPVNRGDKIKHRLWDLPALLANPHLSEKQQKTMLVVLWIHHHLIGDLPATAAAVAEYIAGRPKLAEEAGWSEELVTALAGPPPEPSPWRPPDRPTERAVAELESALSTEEHWRTALNLLTSGFSGAAPSLVAVTLAVT